MGIRRAQDSAWKIIASVTDVPTEGQMSRGKNRALQSKSGAHVRSSAVTTRSRAREERDLTTQLVALLLLSRLNAGRRIVKDAQNGTIRNRTQRPLPVIFIGKRAGRSELHHAQQCTERNVNVELGARVKSDSLSQRGQERRRRDFESIEARQQVRRRVVSRTVGEDGQSAIGRAENLHNGAHLGNAGVIANVSRDSSRLFRSPQRKRHAHQDCPSSELS